MRTITDYVIWSIEHSAWWRPGSMGYCDTVAEAGCYTREEAARIVTRANIVKFNECMIPVAALKGARPVGVICSGCGARLIVGAAALTRIGSVQITSIDGPPNKDPLRQLVQEAIQHFEDDRDAEHIIDMRDWVRSARAALAAGEA